MALSTDKTVNVLNNLIETCLDGERGYHEAAEEVSNSSLKTTFLKAAQDRASFAADLKGHVRRLGGDPEKTGSTAAAVHRTWMNVRDAITGKDDEAILAEVDRGEEVAVDAYTDALAQDLPADVASVVQKQADAIKDIHREMHTLAHT